MPQEALNALVSRRIAAAGGEDTGTAVVCVVRRFDLYPWIRGVCTFAALLDHDEAAGWRRAFTRTLYLAGDPERLRHRFAFRYVDEAFAWTAPGGAAGLRRLLKLFPGPRPLPTGPPRLVTLPPGGGPLRELYVATAGMTVAGTMVNLGHLLAEAVLDGLLAAGDRLAVHCVPRLGGVAGPFEAVRVAADPTDPERLYACAGLTREIPHG